MKVDTGTHGLLSAEGSLQQAALDEATTKSIVRVPGVVTDNRMEVYEKVLREQKARHKVQMANRSRRSIMAIRREMGSTLQATPSTPVPVRGTGVGSAGFTRGPVGSTDPPP